MSIDIVYLSWNRLRFTQKSFEALLENTNWDMVRSLYIYDDGSKDGTAQWLKQQVKRVPVLVNFFDIKMSSPVRTMNFYLDQAIADLFAKVDNDIVVPPGWLDMLFDVMNDHPEVELLGFEAGMSGLPPTDADPLVDMQEVRNYLPARHIGGVGLMRYESFMTRPRVRPNGRFGFTEWMHRYQPICGWIQPDILVSDLSRIPVEPWVSLSNEYVQKGWQRPWGKNDPLQSCYWDYWANA